MKRKLPLSLQSKLNETRQQRAQELKHWILLELLRKNYQ